MLFGQCCCYSTACRHTKTKEPVHASKRPHRSGQMIPAWIIELQKAFSLSCPPNKLLPTPSSTADAESTSCTWQEGGRLSPAHATTSHIPEVQLYTPKGHAASNTAKTPTSRACRKINFGSRKESHQRELHSQLLHILPDGLLHGSKIKAAMWST